FAVNPARVAEWQTVISAQDTTARELGERALALSRSGGVLNLTGHSGPLNDMYWGAFSATGRTDFIQKLVEQLRYWDEREDEQLFFAGATAGWSLSSRARTDSLVRSTLERQRLTADERTRALISEVLQEEPAQIKQDIAAVVEKQRETGKWR